MRRFILLSLAVAAISGFAPTAQAAGKIGLSFSDFATERWPRERDEMSKLLKDAGYEVVVQEANHDAKLQNDQIKNMVTQGAKVIIVVAEDGDSAATAVEEVAKKGVKVIAYDRLIKTPKIAAYVSFDNVDVGRNQAKGVLAVKNSGNFVLLGGSPTDNNAHLFRAGQMEVLNPLIKAGKIKVVADQWVENWDAGQRQEAHGEHPHRHRQEVRRRGRLQRRHRPRRPRGHEDRRPGRQGPHLRPGRHRGRLQLHRPRRAHRHDPQGHPQADPARLRARGQAREGREERSA